MKISECDIDCYLVDWYGVDKNGYIFQEKSFNHTFDFLAFLFR